MRPPFSMLFIITFVLSLGMASCSKEDQSAQLIYNQTISASEATVPEISSGKPPGSLVVKFESGIRPFGVKEYRMIVVKSVLSLSFDHQKAEKLESSRFLNLKPGRKTYHVALAPGILDNDGDQVRSGIDYKVFVYSVPDNNLSNTGALSPPSFEFSLPSY